ncbi:MAG TPA: ABC transporter ATP-binding protein/permease, partial [Chloroflexota bacterium]|nr:ABC transporter ATP-binding protein/permease [Chloroflexota bacterium]
MLALGAVRIQPRLAAAVVGLAALSSLVPTAFSLATGGLIGVLPQLALEGESPDGWRRLAGSVALLGGLFVLQQVIGPLQSVAADALGRRFMASVYRRVMRATLRPATIAHLEEPELHNKVREAIDTGGIGPRTALTGLIGWSVERLRGAIALVVVAHFNVWLALLLAAAWLHHLRRIRAVHHELIRVRFVRTQSMRQADYLAAVLTSSGEAKEVRIFGLGRWFAEQYERTWLGAIGELWEKRRDLLPSMARATLPVLAVDALVFWLIGRAAVTGEIGVGALIVYANAVFESGRFGDVTEADLQVEYGTAGLKSLAKLERLVETRETLLLPGTRPASGLPREAIRFEGVAFRYSGQKEDVFRNLTLKIPAGKSMALVGANGAGKTTLIKLLARLYDPTEGQITVDGVDLREIDARSWQRRVAAIFQDF